MVRLDTALRAWLRAPAILRAAPPVAMMLLLWWLSSRQADAGSSSQLWAFLHNSMHVVAYSALGGAIWLGLPRAPDLRRHFVAPWLIAVAYGSVDEWHQSFVPGRVCSVSDLITDSCAAAMALAFLRSRLLADPTPRFRPLLWLLVCALATAFATWGPW